MMAVDKRRERIHLNNVLFALNGRSGSCVQAFKLNYPPDFLIRQINAHQWQPCSVLELKTPGARAPDMFFSLKYSNYTVFPD